MWTALDIQDVEAIERFVEVMHQMDGRYMALTLAQVRSTMKRRGAELDRYAGPDFELYMYFRPSRRQQRHYLWSVGMAGNVTAAAAVDLLADNMQRYLERHCLEEAYAIRPWTMDYGPIQEVHDWVPKHPDFEVTVVEESPDSAIWKLMPRPRSIRESSFRVERAAATLPG